MRLLILIALLYGAAVWADVADVDAYASELAEAVREAHSENRIEQVTRGETPVSEVADPNEICAVADDYEFDNWKYTLLMEIDLCTDYYKQKRGE